MFNEVTLSLHILLLVLIYLFLFAAVRVISKDLSITRKERLEQKLPKFVILEDEDGDGIGEYPVADQLVIGRSPDCDIILDDTFTSSHHAKVYPSHSGYWLEDLQSTNGTIVNGKQIEKPVRLTKGSTFKIGQSVFRFVE